MTLKPYNLRVYAGPLFGRVLRVMAEDEIDAAGIVGRALGMEAMNTGDAIYAPPPAVDLFGSVPEAVETITIDEARRLLNANG